MDVTDNRLYLHILIFCLYPLSSGIQCVVESGQLSVHYLIFAFNRVYMLFVNGEKAVLSSLQPPTPPPMVSNEWYRA